MIVIEFVDWGFGWYSDKVFQTSNGKTEELKSSGFTIGPIHVGILNEPFRNLTRRAIQRNLVSAAMIDALPEDLLKMQHEARKRGEQESCIQLLHWKGAYYETAEELEKVKRELRKLKAFRKFLREIASDERVSGDNNPDA